MVIPVIPVVPFILVIPVIPVIPVILVISIAPVLPVGPVFLVIIPIENIGAHLPTPRYGQYLTHAHNHITRAVAAMDSCFPLVGAHQHGIAVGSMDQDYPAHQRPCTAEASASTALRASYTVNKW